MCAASHSWHAFRIVDDKTGHVERTNVDFVFFYMLQWDPPDRAPISRNKALVGYILIRDEDVGVGVGVVKLVSSSESSMACPIPTRPPAT